MQAAGRIFPIVPMRFLSCWRAPRGLDKSVDRKYNDDVNLGENSCRWIVNQKMVVAGNDARFVKRLDKVGEVYAQ